jgi:hypothetical protein
MQTLKFKININFVKLRINLLYINLLDYYYTLKFIHTFYILYKIIVLILFICTIISNYENDISYFLSKFLGYYYYNNNNILGI